MPQHFETMQALATSLAGRPDVRRQPAVIAFGEEDSRTITYAELAETVDAMARALVAIHQANGGGSLKGERVCLLAPPRWEAMAAALAVLAAGAVAMPVDMQFPDEQMRHVLTDGAPAILIAVEETAARVEALALKTPPVVVRLDHPAGAADSLFTTPEHAASITMETVAPADQAALFYTSGTTGRPKGVELTHANLAFQMTAVAESGILKQGDALLLPLPLHHVYPFVLGIFSPFLMGLTAVLPAAFTGPQLVRAMREGDVSVVAGVPRLYSALVAGVEARVRERGVKARFLFQKMLSLSGWSKRRLGVNLGKTLFKSLHERFGPRVTVTASGGSALDPQLAETMEALGWRVAVGYGLTETSPLLTLKSPWTPGGLDTVGKTIPGVQLRIDKEAAPEGAAAGEVQAKGPGVFRGYRNLPEKTAEAFTPDGWFRTGDLGQLDENGVLRLAGRASTLIVTQGGENVQPEPVEAALEEHAAITEAGVLEWEGKLAAVLVPEEKEVRSLRSEPMTVLREAVAEVSRKLPSYMRPTELALSREPIPRTRLGKVRRHKLVELFERARAGQAAQTPESLAPMDPVDMAAADRALLESPAARSVWEYFADRYPTHGLSPDANLQIDLGVDSLEWLTLSLDIRARTGVELTQEDAADADTVRDLLRILAERGKGCDTEPPCAPEQGRVVRVSPFEHPEAYLAEEERRFLEPLGPVKQLLADVSHMEVRVLFNTYFSLETEGLERVPKDMQVVFAPNHVSYLDPFALIAAMDRYRMRRTQFAAWTGAAFSNPVNAFFSRLARAVPIDPDRGAATSLALGALVLERGRSMVWFPEGVRSRTCRLRDFRPGLGMLLERLPTTLVPVFIHGTCESMRPGVFWPRPRPVRVVFGEPVTVETLLAETEGEDTPKPARIMQGLRDRVESLGRDSAAAYARQAGAASEAVS